MCHAVSLVKDLTFTKAKYKVSKKLVVGRKPTLYSRPNGSIVHNSKYTSVDSQQENKLVFGKTKLLYFLFYWWLWYTNTYWFWQWCGSGSGFIWVRGSGSGSGFKGIKCREKLSLTNKNIIFSQEIIFFKSEPKKK